MLHLNLRKVILGSSPPRSLDTKGSVSTKSCPNLLDGVEDMDSGIVPSKKKKTHINNTTSSVVLHSSDISVILSSAEAEDIHDQSSLDINTDMLLRYRQRSHSMERVSLMIKIDHVYIMQC